jgi:hypothetical protein
MERAEFPLIVSPNLECPRITSLEGLKKGETSPLIIAGLYGEFTSPFGERDEVTAKLSTINAWLCFAELQQ